MMSMQAYVIPDAELYLEEQPQDVTMTETTIPVELEEEQTEGHSDHESDAIEEDEAPEKGVSHSVAEDLTKFEASFKDLSKRYRLIDRIGEGTFSTVYKAEDLEYERFENGWDTPPSWQSPPVHKGARDRRKARYVAIKKIYVTSSPIRILNELELLHDLRGSSSVCPLITACRYQDQVVAILPYYQHQDFREYYKEMRIPEIRDYIRSLFSALAHTHAAGIIHRDIKPTNFLYNYYQRTGVLVDFGLAERQGTDRSPCVCEETTASRKVKIQNSYAAKNAYVPAYPKNDTRPSRRANRAGTRGFRAPEVLFKCTSQTIKLDIWSVGVILLTILAQRFPFFNSTDDIDAVIEIASIFGKRRMAACALLHGTCFECTIPSVGEKGFPFDKLIAWSTCRTTSEESQGPDDLQPGEKTAIRLLEQCLELDAKKRISASAALEHEFLAGTGPEEGEDADEDAKGIEEENKDVESKE